MIGIAQSAAMGQTLAFSRGGDAPLLAAGPRSTGKDRLRLTVAALCAAERADAESAELASEERTLAFGPELPGMEVAVGRRAEVRLLVPLLGPSRVAGGVYEARERPLGATRPAWWPSPLAVGSPAIPFGCAPPLARGPVGERELVDPPAPLGGRARVPLGAGAPTVIGIVAPPPPPAASVTDTVTSYSPGVPSVTRGARDDELGAPPSKFQS